MTASIATHRPRSINAGTAPIPMGARLGNIICSSGLMGEVPATDKLPEVGAARRKFLYQKLRGLLKIGGTALQDMAHAKTFVKTIDTRALLNKDWPKCFLDTRARSARHRQAPDFPGGMPMQIEIFAVMHGN